MRSTLPPTARTSTRRRLTAALAACALLGGTALFSATAATAAPRASGPALNMALRDDLRQLPDHPAAGPSTSLRSRCGSPSRRDAGHQPGRPHGPAMAGGRTGIDGRPVAPIGSNTKAFTAVILLQLEAEGRLSVSDPIGRVAPAIPGLAAHHDQSAAQHDQRHRGLCRPARLPCRHRRQPQNPLLRSPPGVLRRRRAARPPRLELLRHQLHPRADDHREGHAPTPTPSQLTSRIIRAAGACGTPATGALHLPGSPCRPDGNRVLLHGRAASPSLLGQPMPKLALTWAQGAGGIVSSLQDLTTRERRRTAAGYSRRASSASSEPGLPGHRRAHHRDHTDRSRIRAWHLPDHHPADRDSLVLRGRHTRLPSRAFLLPPVRHHHRGRHQQLNRPRRQRRPAGNRDSGIPDPRNGRRGARQLTGRRYRGYRSQPRSTASSRALPARYHGVEPPMALIAPFAPGADHEPVDALPWRPPDASTERYRRQRPDMPGLRRRATWLIWSTRRSSSIVWKTRYRPARRRRRSGDP